MLQSNQEEPLQPMLRVQRWEATLKAAGWKPLAAHPNSPSWVSPDGTLVPGPGYAYMVMQSTQAAK